MDTVVVTVSRGKIQATSRMHFPDKDSRGLLYQRRACSLTRFAFEVGMLSTLYAMFHGSTFRIINSDSAQRSANARFKLFASDELD